MAFLNHSHRLHSPTYTPTFAITVSLFIFPSLIHKCPSQRFLVPSTLQSGCLACGQCIPVPKIFAKQPEEQFFSTEHPLLHLHANVYIKVFSFPSPATPPLPSGPSRGLPGSPGSTTSPGCMEFLRISSGKCQFCKPGLALPDCIPIPKLFPKSSCCLSGVFEE